MTRATFEPVGAIAGSIVDRLAEQRASQVRQQQTSAHIRDDLVIGVMCIEIGQIVEDECGLVRKRKATP